MGQHHRPLMDPIRDGTDGSQGTVQVGTGESWWDRSGSAWGEDDMTGDDVAVTRGGGGINLGSSQKGKSKAAQTKSEAKQIKKLKIANEKQQTRKKSRQCL